ncbi:DUF1963 domain-containing protein [Micromonospora sp. LAH09]|uniref:DUF1963 domain-containing protein n=1 Tax=Micromonospora cabrerizensis TaxID=2911213 RepID=UPI001EE8C4C9|nr:DUF1963 domain-containing protein [Micromonospora cabrerizensis]MCG5468977.1 DUF1963 domain-containing protein [Micromonospora cabrerizensis]
MVKLMTYAGPASDDAFGTRTGGLPHVPREFEWPRCRECAGPMQFLAQVDLADVEPDSVGLLSVFMCQNDPGLCDEWDPGAGGNRAFIFLTDIAPTHTPPGDGITLLDATCAVEFEDIDAENYLDAPEHWHQRSGRPQREVLGQLGGQPAWLQNDETPTCGTCAVSMAFVVQLEEGHDHRTSINFGGGCGYAFYCRGCATAAFLWQC